MGLQPRPWDQRHTINVDVNYRPNLKWYWNFAWQYRSGWPYTDFQVKRIQREDDSYAYYHDYGTFNGSRYPAYHRLDVRINRNINTAKGKIIAFLHIINLYNRKNIYAYDHDIVKANSGGFRHIIVKETWFGLMPFAGISWEF